MGIFLAIGREVLQVLDSLEVLSEAASSRTIFVRFYTGLCRVSGDFIIVARCQGSHDDAESSPRGSCVVVRA